jgi:hypothetical protein
MMIVSASLTNGDLYLVISNTSIFRRPGKMHYLPSGKHTKNYGTSPCYEWVNPLFLWAIFNSFLYVYQRVFINETLSQDDPFSSLNNSRPKEPRTEINVAAWTGN